MKNNEALNYIMTNGATSRTIIFNAIMASVTTFLVAVSVIIDSPIVEALLVPTLTFISSIGNIILYGMTHVKHKGDRHA